MKQNIYDDATFFAKYLDYRKSSKCLNSALEQPYLHRLLPELKGKRILDIGSGMGVFSRYAIEQGASFVLGLDISSRMCLQATTLLKGLENVRIINSAIEDFNWEGEPFDLIVSSLALHYVTRLEETIKKTASWLRTDGYYVVSVNHPFYTASLPETNTNAPTNEGNYWRRGTRVQHLLGTEVVKYHETLEGYFQCFQSAGLQITSIKDLSPFQIGLDSWEGDEGLTQRPVFMLIKARKN